MLSHFRMEQELGGRRHYNEVLFPAEDLRRLFAWARRNGREVSNIDPLIVGSGFTEPSMKFERYRTSFSSRERFETDSLAAAKGLMDYAESRGGKAFYVVSLDDSDGHRLLPHHGAKPSCDPYLAADVLRSDGQLQVMFRLIDIAQCVSMPRSVQSRRTDDLWRKTCFEVFAITPSQGYAEFNISPSTEWAAYGFTDYRAGMSHLDAQIETTRQGGPNAVTVLANIRWSGWSGAERIGLSAVIEDIDGNISYWALAHPSDKPDFHHPDSFVLDLP